MPARFLLQPDGRLCRFSTIVDDFTHGGLTPEGAFAVAFEDMGRRAAEQKVARGLARGLDAKGGWHDCLRTVSMVHGPEHADAVAAELLGAGSESEEVAEQRQGAVSAAKAARNRKQGNVVFGAALGASFGGAFGGPVGLLVGGVLGAAIGSSAPPRIRRWRA